MDVQVCPPPVLATIYNFIYVHDPKEIDDMLSPGDIGINDIKNRATDELTTELPSREGREPMIGGTR